MLTLRDIMTRDVVTLSPELSLRDAMDVLSTRHISGAPVVRGGTVVGVVSLTDLAEFAAASPGVPTDRPEMLDTGEWQNPVDLTDDDAPASAFFAEMWEDAGSDVAERMATSGSSEWNSLEEHTVSEAMSRNVLALPPSTPVAHASAVMRRARIHRVLVIEDSELVGVATTTDVMNAVADNRLTSRVYVFGRAAAAKGD
jgi:CBS domain-containing protein